MEQTTSTNGNNPWPLFTVLTPEQAHQVSGGSKKKAVAPAPAPPPIPGGPSILPGDGGPSTPEYPFD